MWQYWGHCTNLGSGLSSSMGCFLLSGLQNVEGMGGAFMRGSLPGRWGKKEGRRCALSNSWFVFGIAMVVLEVISSHWNARQSNLPTAKLLLHRNSTNIDGTNDRLISIFCLHMRRKVNYVKRWINGRKQKDTPLGGQFFVICSPRGTSFRFHQISLLHVH